MSYHKNVQEKANWMKELHSSGRKRKIIQWDFRNLSDLKTFWFSDVHYGHKQSDKDLFLSNVERVRKKKMPCADLGDLIENATRDSIGAGVYEQEDIAQEQLEEAVEIYKPLAEAGLIMSMQPGNHELRTHNKSGINLTRVIAKMLKAHELNLKQVPQGIDFPFLSFFVGQR